MSKVTEKALADETDILVNRIIEQGVDGVIGGFPCQDISNAGFPHTGSPGLAGSRSGLFWSMAETFRLVGAKYWLMENVAALFQRNRSADMGAILGCVAAIWYDAEWDCVGASTVGAPHHRARAYILANSDSNGWEGSFPKQIQRQQEFESWKDIRSVEELRERRGLFRPNLFRANDGIKRRLHAIGNGNPPCIIRELTRNIK